MINNFPINFHQQLESQIRPQQYLVENADVALILYHREIHMNIGKKNLKRAMKIEVTDNNLEHIHWNTYNP